MSSGELECVTDHTSMKLLPTLASISREERIIRELVRCFGSEGIQCINEVAICGAIGSGDGKASSVAISIRFATAEVDNNI
jgi:hypothetical protein